MSGGHVSSASGFFWLGSGVWAAETCLVSVCVFLDDRGSLALLTFFSSKTSFANSFLVLFFSSWHCQPNNLKSHVTSLDVIFKEFLKIINIIHNSKRTYIQILYACYNIYRHTHVHTHTHIHI